MDKISIVGKPVVSPAVVASAPEAAKAAPAGPSQNSAPTETRSVFVSHTPGGFAVAVTTTSVQQTKITLTKAQVRGVAVKTAAIVGLAATVGVPVLVGAGALATLAIAAGCLVATGVAVAAAHLALGGSITPIG